MLYYGARQVDTKFIWENKHASLGFRGSESEF